MSDSSKEDIDGILSDSDDTNASDKETEHILITDFKSKAEPSKSLLKSIEKESTKQASPAVPIISIPFNTKNKIPQIQNQKLDSPSSTSNTATQNQGPLLLTSLKSPIIASLRKSIAKEDEKNKLLKEQKKEKKEEEEEKNEKHQSSIREEASVNENEADNLDQSKKNDAQTEVSVPQIPIQPQYTDEELESALNGVLNNKIMPLPEMHQSVLSYAKRVQYDAVIDEDYDKAEEIEEAVKFLERNGESKQVKVEPVITVDMRIEQTKQNIEDTENKYKNRLQSFENSKKLRLKELENAHAAEIAALEENVSSPDFLHQFDKPSANLLQVRELQRTRAFQKDFIGAKQMKKIGDEMEKRETEEAKKKAVAKIELMYKQLLDKQKREIACAKENWKRQKIAIQLEKEAELNPMKALLSQLERNGHQSLKYTVKHRSTSSAQPSYAPVTCAVTPRTRKKVVEFKQRGQGRLNLVGLDTTKYIKPNRPVSHQKKSLQKADF